MGLDTTHDCWHGAYSSFHTWRHAVAAAAGIPLEYFAGFYAHRRAEAEGAYPWRARDDGQLAALAAVPDTFVTSLAQATNRSEAEVRALPLPLSWDLLAGDPLVALLNHSDCDGTIAAADCLPLAERLEGLLVRLPDDAPVRMGLRERAVRFARGLRLAAERGEDVEFR